MHSTYIATVERRAPDGKRVECYRPCCQGCAWSGQLHAARRNAHAEEREHLTEVTPGCDQPTIF